MTFYHPFYVCGFFIISYIIVNIYILFLILYLDMSLHFFVLDDRIRLYILILRIM